MTKINTGVTDASIWHGQFSGCRRFNFSLGVMKLFNPDGTGSGNIRRGVC